MLVEAPLVVHVEAVGVVLGLAGGADEQPGGGGDGGAGDQIDAGGFEDHVRGALLVAGPADAFVVVDAEVGLVAAEAVPEEAGLEVVGAVVAVVAAVRVVEDAVVVEAARFIRIDGALAVGEAAG